MHSRRRESGTSNAPSCQARALVRIRAAPSAIAARQGGVPAIGERGGETVTGADQAENGLLSPP